VSKYKGLLDAIKEEPVGETETPTQSSDPTPRRGRPPGKRSDPDYEQVTAYVRRDTYRAVKIAQLEDGLRHGFSDLVEELLAAWLESRSLQSGKR
jgi:hypothetical protein